LIYAIAERGVMPWCVLEGRSVCLSWEHSKPKGPQGSISGKHRTNDETHMIKAMHLSFLPRHCRTKTTMLLLALFLVLGSERRPPARYQIGRKSPFSRPSTSHTKSESALFIWLSTLVLLARTLEPTFAPHQALN